jgi:hypothetical protein
MIANAAVAREIKNGSRCDVLLPPQVNGALKDNVRLKPQLCFLTYLRVGCLAIVSARALHAQERARTTQVNRPRDTCSAVNEPSARWQ